VTNANVYDAMEAVVSRAGRVLLATDFDGTLCAIADSPRSVSLSEATIEVVRSLILSPRLELAVISGRSLSDLRQLLPFDATLAGNHGLEIEGKGIRFRHPGAASLRPFLERACKTLRRAIRHWPKAWVEEKGLTATLHFRNAPALNADSVLFATQSWLADFSDELEFRSAIESVEIRPRVNWDKGSAMGLVFERLGPFDACICLGDDQTDEAMFRSAHSRLSIRIGEKTKNSAANQFLPRQEQVLPLLAHLAEMVNRKDSAAAAGGSYAWAAR